MKKILLVTLLLMYSALSFGQGSIKELAAMPKDKDGRYPFWRCGTVEINEALRAQNPKLPSVEAFEKFMNRATKERKMFRMQPLDDRIKYIPVVVHVIHSGEAVGQGSNISYAQIQSQIEVLNEDFRRKEGSRGFNNHPAGADAQIEFILAEVDPHGNPLQEAGVHRVRNRDLGVSGALDPYSMDGIVKPATYWDPNRYLNMWTAELDGGLLGYAQFPVSSGLDGLDIPGLETAAETDGVVMRYTTFGSSDKGDFNLMAPYDKGRTTTHEVGHWLGLRHIWGDGGCGMDDFCTDTPESDGPNHGCDTKYFSCGTEDMTQNYMDYSTDPCMSIFTLEQKERFLTVLEYSPRRKELLNSDVLARANFVAGKTSVYQGQTVKFTDRSAGAINSWNWVFEGGEPATSSRQNPEVTYRQPGTYSVRLTAGNNNDIYEEFKDNYITVAEPASVPSVNFSADRSSVFTGQGVQFEDASHASVFSWHWEFRGGEPATSSIQNPVVQYRNRGTFGVKLTVRNAKGVAERVVENMISVAEGPQLIASPAELEKALFVGESATGFINLANPGDQPLNYTITSGFDEGIITFNPGEETGTIRSGSGKTIQFTFSTGELNGGRYKEPIRIQTNDPRNEITEIPVTLRITGVPAVAVSDSEVDFGNILRGNTRYYPVVVHNTGTDTLRLRAELSSEVFSLETSAYKIPAKAEAVLRLAFNPREIRHYSANLLLHTNDPENRQLTVRLAGNGVPAPEIAVNPDQFKVALLAGDSVNELLSIRNRGGADLNFTLKFTNRTVNEKQFSAGLFSSSAETDSTTSAFLSLNSSMEDASVLVIQNTDAWVTDIQRDILAPMGIAAHKINSSSISSTDFSVYDLIVTAGDEDYRYYNALSANAAKFEDFVRSGGSVLYQTATQGDNVTLAGGVLSEHGLMAEVNEVVNGNHTIMEGLPGIINGTWASHNVIRNLPQNAGIITVSGNGEKLPTTVEYSIGAGTIIATGMTWEYAFSFGHNYGVLTSRSVAYLLENSVGWLSADKNSGSVPGNSEEGINLKFNAKNLMGGTYYGDVLIASDDPLNELVTVPVTLEVTGVPVVALSDNQMNFGKIREGEKQVRPLTIQNQGSDGLTVAPALDNGIFTVDLTPVTIPARSSYVLEIAYAPVVVGTTTAVLTLSTNDPRHPELEVELQGTAVAAPRLVVNPASFSIELNSGEAKRENLLIENKGGDTLFYSLRGATLNERKGAEQKARGHALEVRLVKGEKDERKGAEISARSGDDGPDGFGYKWTDSKAANGPQFNWIDISATGTILYLGDDSAQPVELPFPFSFYGEEKEMVYVGSNGFLTFNENNASSLSNSQIPNSYPPNDLIAAYWTDLYPGDRVKYLGREDLFIIQFTDVPRFGGSGLLTFQYILYPNGDIKIQYKQSTDTWHSATIGIENATGTDGLQIAFNTPYVENNLAVLISTDKVIDFEPDFGQVIPGGSANVEVIFNGDGLFGGTYEKEILLSTNDPLQEETIIPVILEVRGIPRIELSETVLNFNSARFTGVSETKKLVVRNSGTMALELNSLAVSSDKFIVNNTPVSVPPGERVEIEVGFLSAEVGQFREKLVIESNDPDKGRLEISLEAEVSEPPVIEISTQNIRRSLSIGDKTDKLPLEISNKGGYPLSISFSSGATGFEAATREPVKDREVGFYAVPAPSSAVAPALYMPGTDRNPATGEESLIEETYPYFIYGARGMCWINEDLYVLQYSTGGVYIYDPETSQAKLQFYVPQESYGLTWDGEYLWTASYQSAQAYDLSGNNKGNFNLPYSNGYYRSVAWDGSAFIVCTPFEYSGVHRVNERGQVLETFSLPAGVKMDQLTISGSTWWVLDLQNYELLSVSVVQDQLHVNGRYPYPSWEQGYALAVDNRRKLWMADWSALYRLNLTDLSLPEWVFADLASADENIPAGEERIIDFAFEAGEGLRVGSHSAELQINSNDPAVPLTSVMFELEVLNSPPHVTGAVQDVAMVFGGNDLQIDLSALFNDINVEDQINYFARAENSGLEVTIGGNMLNIRAAESGRCRVNLFATDQRGARSEEISFVVTVAVEDNQAPEMVAGGPLIDLLQEGQSHSINLDNYFTDPDGDRLEYRVTVNNASCMNAEVSGNTLNLLAIEKGLAIVAVKALDGKGGAADLIFNINVNAQPKGRTAIPAHNMAIKSDTLHFRFSEVFSDADGDIMTFEAHAENNEVVSLLIQNDIVKVVAQKKGETVITFTAGDNKAGRGQVSFPVWAHYAPEAKKAIKDQEVALSKVHSINLFPYFNEPDGEQMSFAVSYDHSALEATVEGSVLELKGLKTGSGVVTIRVSDTRGATFVTGMKVNVVDVLSVKGDISGNFKIYPNPFTNSLEIETSGQVPLSVMIFDQLSRLLQKQQWESGSGKKCSVNVTDLPPGTYLLKIVTPAGVTTHSVVKL